jgi:glycosyltransferase involved in cell wall biosynthesis
MLNISRYYVNGTSSWNARMTEERKISYITVSYPYGDGESFIGPEINEWVRRGYSVDVIPLRPRGALRPTFTGKVVKFPLFRLGYLAKVAIQFLREPVKTIIIFRDILRMPRKLPKNVIATVKAFAVAELLTRSPAKHIHAHWGGASSTMALVVSRVTGIPWSLTCHRWDIYENNLLALKSDEARFVRFISERGKADAILLGAHPDKSVVIHMGVDLSECRCTLRKVSERPQLVCAANMLEVKGHRYLIEALALLRNDGVDVELDLYGDGPERQALTELCEARNLQNFVRFQGHRPRCELLDALGSGKYDVFVLTSIEISASVHEGIPVSLMEAMSCGVPVISTKTGSIEELLPPALNATVQDRDPTALAAAIHGLLMDHERYATFSQTVRRMIENEWQITAVIDKLESMIQPA